MATTDSRSGFRLPWSSGRSSDHQDLDGRDEAAEAVPEAGANEPATSATSVTSVPTEVADQLHEPEPDAPPEPATFPAPIPEEPEAMVDTVSAATSAREAATRRPSKLMADLATAMRATAQTAREQALSQLDADANQVIETVRARSTEGASELRQRSDGDVAGIREWSKAEIARIRDETDRRVSARKALFETEISEHAAAIEQRIAGIQRTVADYQEEMADFFERLLHEEDPARLATMAESMPEPPSLEAWADVEDLVPAAIAAAQAEAVTPEAPVEEAATAHDDVAAAAADDTPDVGAVSFGGPASDVPPDAEIEAEAVVEAASEAVVEAEVDAEAELPATGWGETAVTGEPVSNEWGETPSAPEADAEPETGVEAETAAMPAGEASVEEAPEGADAVVPGWPSVARRPVVDPWGADEGWQRPTASDIESGSTAAERNGWEPADPQPVDRDVWGTDRSAVMSALEATAEGIAAAEADAAAFATAYADRGNAEADAWDTAGEGSPALEAEADSPAVDAPDADRLDPAAEQSLADRLANLIPRRETFDGEDMQQTQIIVTGLVSVASIASMKRHLSRLAGVQSVAVASGPQGEFVFNATHRADVSFDDALPLMPGFGARVTDRGDGVLNVTAHDPEAEG